ncbi:MAG: hypothetical protein LBQ54_08700, partial [Planctomycetaceae bacterium]|nr:hypothetical protein [Planctomycetaceae bacterium]
MKSLFCLLPALIVLLTSLQTGHAETKVMTPKVNHRSEPVGIESGRPVFRWNLEDTERNTFQQSYRLTTASHPALLGKTPDFWDSGWVDSNECVEVEYAGKTLSPSRRYYWNVQVRNHRGQVSSLFRPASFV